MYNIDSKYEVLYSDLRNHYIGEFLVSREFRLFMSKIGAYATWMEVFRKAESKRNYFAVGINHEIGDAVDAFGIYLNELQSDHGQELERLIAQIIGKFIEFKKEKTDFSDILESSQIAGFKQDSLQLIQEAIKIHESKDFPKKEIQETKKPVKGQTKMDKQKVFIVHGHNQELKINVARVIEKLKLTPIILHEQSNKGLTVIEKFEKRSDVSFAIVLLTFDDYGQSKTGENKNKRARQNVVLELGYFLAKLGRENVMPLYEEGVELPSDISGVLYTIIDESENWKFRLVKELKDAGFKVDANDIL